MRSSSRCSGVASSGVVLEQSGDAPHLGAHARGGDDSLPMPVGRGGAAEDHVVPIAERHVLGDHGGILRDRQALAGECSLRRLQGGGLDQPAIGRNGVAFLDEDDVARDDLRRGDASPLAASDHGGISRRHRAKCRDGSLGTRLLHIAHGRVQEHDGKDGDGFVGEGRVALHDPERRGDRCGDEKQDDEHILKLRQESPPRRDRLLRGELVWSVLREPSARFLVAQPALLIGPEPGDQFAGVQAVRHTRLWRFARDGRHVVCSLRGGTPASRCYRRQCTRRVAHGRRVNDVRVPSRKRHVRGALGGEGLNQPTARHRARAAGAASTCGMPEISFKDLPLWPVGVLRHREGRAEADDVHSAAALGALVPGSGLHGPVNGAG